MPFTVSSCHIFLFLVRLAVQLDELDVSGVQWSIPDVGSRHWLDDDLELTCLDTNYGRL